MPTWMSSILFNIDEQTDYFFYTPMYKTLMIFIYKHTITGKPINTSLHMHVYTLQLIQTT